MLFKIVPSTVSKQFHLIIRGSLAKYYNNGKHNGFDYTHLMLEETINELQSKFNVNPNKAIVQAFEIGANIKPSVPVKNIIKAIRAWQNNSFSSFKTEEIFEGKQLKRQEYNFKVYNKGIISPDTPKNLLRIELSIKRSNLAKKYNIRVLADLLNLENLNSIKPLLIEVVRDMIFYDKGAKLRDMSRWQREKWLFYLDSTNWEKFTRVQRYRAKNTFQELKHQFGTSTTQEEILQLLIQKLEILSANNNDKNVYDLCNFSETKCIRSISLNKGIECIHSDKNKIAKKNTPIKRKKCVVCKTDITKKRAGTKYCSKSCNNRNNYKVRKKKLKANKKKVL